MVALRSALLLTFTIALLSLTGCRICQSSEDEAYPTYGGIWQRTDRFHGRVGSVFAPAGAKIAATPSEFTDEITRDEVIEGDEEDSEVLPPGRHPEAAPSTGEEAPAEDASPDASEETESEEVRLQQPLGNVGTYTDF